MKGHSIKKVHPGSIAEEIGIEPGDELVKIDGFYPRDIIDYYYLINDDYLEVLVRKNNSEEWIIELAKDYDESLGVEFLFPIMSEIKLCENNCIFCFISQLPPSMRKSLYFKDDDFRLSIFSGNYITLTNLNKADFKRIIDYKISPLYISVHTTDPGLRKKMMNNENAGYINKQLAAFKNAGIEMYGQIVLCPGINDGDHLKKTLNDLLMLWPQFKNVAVVPVGLTSFKDKLPVGVEEYLGISPVNKQKAVELISLVDKFQNYCIDNIGTSFVFLADEFYLISGQQLPPYEHYEDFIQLENGVGLIRKFEKEFIRALEKYTEKNYFETQDKRNLAYNQSQVSIVTGKSAEDFMNYIVDLFNKINPNFNLVVYGITNDFFGELVTVTGLLTGHDIKKSLKKEFLDEILLVPEVMLNEEEVFLDNTTIEEVESYLCVNIIKSPVNGRDFFELLYDLCFNRI